MFVEVDPSQAMYKGYRRSETFYTLFSGRLFERVCGRLAALEEVRLDGFSSVSSTGLLVQVLVDVAQGKNKRVVWADSLMIGRLEEKHEVGVILCCFYIHAN